MGIIFMTLMLMLGGVVWLTLIAMALGAYYLLGRAVLKNIRQAFLQPGEAQITAYEIQTPNLEEDNASDTRPMIRLELDYERYGQHFKLNLGPLPCWELFPALAQSKNRAACWMTHEDWQQLLQGRHLKVLCDLKRAEAILTTQVRFKREIFVTALLALATLFILALLQV